ncbi:MAG: DUF11 domain-containing protein [Lysobacteraceae bacterium]
MSSPSISVNPDTLLQPSVSWRGRANGLLMALLVLGGVVAAGGAQAAQVCPVPDPNPPSSATGVVNAYFAGTSGTLASGATQLTLGNRHGGSAAGDIQAGDLLLVIQMQDAQIDSSNNANYGSGSGDGMGSTSMGNAGLHEFVVATSAGGSGSVINFTPALSNSYVQAAAVPDVRGQRSYQVIRVPRYRSVSVAGVHAPAWNGSSGGVVAIDASGTLTLGAGTVEGVANRAVFVAGRGFRGAAGRSGATLSNDLAWRWSDAGGIAHGGKGEGIAGTPRYLARKTNDFGLEVTGTSLVQVNTGIQGYPFGDRARGAPGNAGGGGTEGTYSPGTADNTRNAGGGGGGNHAPGGLGGRPWDAPLNDTNGRGGAGYAGVIGFNRVILGGGGGSGGSNNASSDSSWHHNLAMACTAGDGRCSSGASGGGIVILRARNIVGSGVIDVRGAHGYNVRNDAAGGGGAGGSVVLHTIEGGQVTVDARGGDGGNAFANYEGTNTVAERHGPGGGGGGGFVVFSPGSMQVNVDASGGAPGISSNGPDDTYGSYGHNGGIATFMPPDVPGVPPGAVCEPDLRLSKDNGIDVLLTSGSTTYTLSVSNTSVVPTTGPITVVDVLPPQLTVADGPVPLAGPQAGDWSCLAASDVLTCTSNTVIPAGGNSVFNFTAIVDAPSGTAIINRGRVGGGGDPNKPIPTPGNTGACVDNHVAPGCAIDIDIVEAPFLSLKKANAGTLLAGGSGQYTLTLTNLGSAPTSDPIRIVDVLPDGVSFDSGFTTTGGFSCSHAAGVVECNSSAVLAVGASATISFTITVDADAPTSVTNRAIAGGGGDPAKPGLPDAGDAQVCPAPVSPADNASSMLTGCASVTDPVRRVQLTLDKTDHQNSMPVNGQTTYHFTVRNSGDADSVGTIHFRDELPAPMTWSNPLVKGGADGADWTCVREDNDSATCQSTAVIPVGGSSTFSLVANVNGANPSLQYINKGRIGGGGDPDLLPGMPTPGQVGTDCTGINVGPGCALDINVPVAQPQIRLAKSHPDPQAAGPGDTITFNLVVSNSGGNASSGQIRVVDVIPPGMTYVGSSSFTSGGFSCDFTATPAPGFLTCNSGTALAAGASTTITYTAQVEADASNPLVNRAQVGGGGDPGLPGATGITPATAQECSAHMAPYLGCAIDPVPLNADLQIGKSQRPGTSGAFQSGPLTVFHGDTVQFSIVIGNNGPATVTGATFTDIIPAQFSTLSIVSAGGSTSPECTLGSYGLSGNTLSGTVTIIAPGGNCTLVVEGTASTLGVGITNTATVAVPPGVNDTDPGNNSSSTQTDIVAMVPALEITKTSPDTLLIPGGSASYTVTVANTGNIPLSNVVVTDPVPAGLTGFTWTCTASSGATCPAASGTGALNETLASLPVGGQVTWAISAQVESTPPNPVANTATASADETCTTPCPATVTVPSSTAPAVAKQFDPDSIDVGGSSTLTITLTNANAGPATLTSDLVDTLPAGVTLTGTPVTTCVGTVAGTAGGSVITLQTGAQIPGGTPGSCTITAPVTSDTPGTFTNTIPAGGLVTDLGSNLLPAEDDLTVTATPPTVTKMFAPDTIGNGGISTLTITLGNTNTVAAVLTADLVDNLPAGVTLASVPTSSCTGTVAGSIGGSTIILASGSEIPVGGCTISASVTSTTSGTVTNTIPAGGLATDLGNNPDPAQADLTVLPAPLVTFSKSANPASGEFVAPGQVITYTLTVQVANAATLGDVLLEDAFGPGLTLLPASLPTGCVASAGGVRCTLAGGATPAGSPYVFQYQAQVDAGATGVVQNVVTASGGAQPGVDPACSAPGVCATSHPIQTPALELVKSVTSSGPYSYGDQISYGFSVTNTGNVSLTGVSVNDPLLGGAISCTPSTLAPTEVASCGPVNYTVGLEEANAGEVINIATASGNAPDDTPVSDTDTVTTPIVQAPALELVKTVTSTGPYNLGSTITYQLVATNTGDVTLTNVSISDAGATLGTCAPVQPATLVPGAALSCSATYEVQPGDVEAGDYTNAASASGTAPDNTPVNDNGAVNTPIAQAPGLELVKTVTSTGPYSAGDVIEYSLVATNAGDVTLSNVSITDAGATLGACTPSQPATLAPGDALTCTASYQVLPADVESGEYINAASASGTAPDNTPVTDNDTVTTPVAQAPALDLVKTVTSTGPYSAGDVIEFSLVATNAGDVTLSNVSITDAGATLGACTPSQPATLAPGDALICAASYEVQPADVEAGEYINAASASGTAPDNTPVIDNDTVTTPVAQAPALDLVKTVTSTGPYSAGDVIAYSLIATNTGDVTLTNVSITDAGAVMGTCTPSLPAILAPGDVLTCTASYEVQPADVEAGEYANIATASGTTPDGGSADDQDSTTTPIAQNPGLELVKAVTSSGPYGAGDSIDYSFTLTNTGDVTLTGVEVVDDLPDLGPLSYAWPGVPGTLAPGQVVVATAAYVVTPADVDEGQVLNVATAAGTPPVQDPLDPPAPVKAPPSQVETPVEPGVLDIAKTGPSSAGTGEDIVFTIIVTNTGQVPVANVVVSDQTPPGLEFVGNSGDCSDPFPCFLGTLAAGDSRVIDVTLRVPHWYSGPNPITNTATVSSTSTDEESSSTATVPLRPLAPLLIPVASPLALLVLALAMLTLGWQVRRRRN